MVTKGLKKYKKIIGFIVFAILIIFLFSKVTWLFRGNETEAREDILGFDNEKSDIDVILFDGSDESSGVEGLHILEGDILRIPDKKGLKIPHIGWNSLELINDGRLFKGMSQNPYVYFVHSYYLKAKDEGIVKAVTDYSTTIHASVEKDNIFACQFHPEKSSTVGLQILKNFAAIQGGKR